MAVHVLEHHWQLHMALKSLNLACVVVYGVVGKDVVRIRMRASPVSFFRLRLSPYPHPPRCDMTIATFSLSEHQRPTQKTTLAESMQLLLGCYFVIGWGCCILTGK
eukprot:3205929-Amphidinium_carterae.1